MASKHDGFRVLQTLNRLTKPRDKGFVHGLAPVDRLVLLALLSYADSDGRCWPSLRRLAEGTSLAKSTVAATLKRLASRDPPLIRRRHRPQPKSTVYEILLPPFPGKDRELDGMVREPDRYSPGAGQVSVREPDTKESIKGAHEGAHEGAHSDLRSAVADPGGSPTAVPDQLLAAVVGGQLGTIKAAAGVGIHRFGEKTAEHAASVVHRLAGTLADRSGFDEQRAATLAAHIGARTLQEIETTGLAWDAAVFEDRCLKLARQLAGKVAP